MDMSRIFSVLWAGKWLAAAGLVVAVLAAGAAGYRLENGFLVPRAERSYTADTLVMLSGAGIPLYQAASVEAVPADGTPAPREQDLSRAAVMFAYLISGSPIRDKVIEQVGPLAADESIDAVQRTTQPSGDERFPGRLALPIVEVHGTASNPKRAVQLVEAATLAFHDYVTEQQESAGLPAPTRVELATIQKAEVKENDVSNTLAPLIAVGFGTLLAFIALIFVLDNVKRTKVTRSRRAAREPSRTEVDGTESISAVSQSDAHEPTPDHRDAVLEPAARG